jgi:hypothetical protein
MDVHEEVDDDRGSSFQLNITLSIGYDRKRANLAGKWEASITSILLLLGGIAVVMLFLWAIFNKLIVI